MPINIEEVTDFKRAVGAVERRACETLRKLARAVPKDQAIVEIGAFKGRTTGYLALGAEEGNGAVVVSVDPWDLRPLETWPENYADAHVIGEYGLKETFEAYKRHLKAAGIVAKQRGAAQVEIRKGFAVDVAKGWDRPVGLLWHDAEHTADAVEADLRAWAPFVAPGGWVVLHDACNPKFGVVEGAKRVLGKDRAWNWRGRRILRWKKNPRLRGILLVQRVR